MAKANSIFNYDNTLPGVITEIDSKLASEYDTSLFGTTDSVCVIGTAFDGPVGMACPVYSVEHAAYLFGKNYDAETRREASLVTGIEDAWNQGCRTIYGMRINGIDMTKDFDFCADTNYKLRLQSRYPSNDGKQCFIKYDDTDGQETFTIYKPAARATISEKMNGLVEDADGVMVNEIRIGEDYGYTKASKLAEVINDINNNGYNNVLELQIIDEDGNVVTNDLDASVVTLGFLFPGVYFMGRSDSACDKQTVLNVNLVVDDDEAPWDGFEGSYYRVLKKNTDVTQPLPIYYTSLKDMRSILAEVSISMVDEDDYLEVTNETNKAFPEDDVDYEESNLTNFEIYQKLGEGFAVTAVADKRVKFDLDSDGNKVLKDAYKTLSADELEKISDVEKYKGTEITPKVHQAALTDSARVQSTGEGAYSILEDTKIRYHVLGNDICADTVIGGKLPKHTAFKKTASNDVIILQEGTGDNAVEYIKATAKVDKDDATAEKAYKFVIANRAIPEIDEEQVYTKAAVKCVGSDTKAKIEAISNAAPGEIAISNDTNALYVANAKGQFVVSTSAKYDGYYFAGTELTYIQNGVEATPDTVIAEDYLIAQTDSDFFIVKNANLDIANFAAPISIAFNDDDDLEVFYTNSCVGQNVVFICYSAFDSMNLTEMVDLLNESELAKVFTFALTKEGNINQEEYVSELVAEVATTGFSAEMETDRERGYDYTMHIPYMTTDNFARHLAQHCTYTELKTYPTHGVIGCKCLSDVSKTSLANKVANVTEFNWNMYVKNNYGRNMLDANNLPYNIGRNISVTLFQEQFTTTSNYTAIVNGATAYAGFVSQLDVGQSSTGQTVDFTPQYEFSRSQLQTLSDAGLVTVKNSYTKGYVVTDGITMASNTDLLRRLFNTRVMHFVEDYIRAACEPFIGKANSDANRNSLNTAITSNLNSIVDTLIRSFEFSIADEDNVDQYTYIDINYTIVPMNEIREIRNYIRVQNS